MSWSYELLDEAERRLLDRLSVLRGGFDLEVAERVAVASRWRRRRSPACWPAWPASRWCRSRPARWSVIRCWRPSASSPPGGWPTPARKPRCTPGCCEWALEVARSAEAALPGAEWPRWSGQLSADQANIRAALSWALGGAEPEAGRELAARLARWWIATGRYSEAGQFLTTAAGRPGRGGSRHPGPGAARRRLVGVPAWATIRAPPRWPPTASPVPGRPANRSWKSGAATCWPAWPGTRATRTGSSPKSKPAGLCPARPIRRSRRGPRSCWPTRPCWLATWPSRSGTACSRSSLPGRRRARKGSPSR